MTAPTTEKIVRCRSALSPLTALRLAWVCWFVFLIIPFFVAYWFIWHTAGEQSPLARASEERWFVAAMTYLALVAPAAFFWRERVFKSYRAGNTVPPKTYLLGMLGVGLTLLTSGLFSLTGCIVVGTLMPNLFPAFLSLLLFLMLWPTGRSMTPGAGNQEDPQLYEEPR
jgi:hypothetical protein